MKRRAMSFITVLALCLSLCPAPALAAGWEPDTGLCPHHQVHTAECGYAAGNAGAPCTFVCRVCPVENLIDSLPPVVIPDNADQVEEQLKAILALYTELTGDEQERLDLQRCLDLLAQLDAASAPAAIDAYNTYSIGQTPVNTYSIPNDTKAKTRQVLTKVTELILNGYSYTYSEGTFIVVDSTGGLYLRSGGRIEASGGTAVEVAAGGFLCVEASDITISGAEYGLYISSGAEVQLSGGAYTGSQGAVCLQADENGAADFSGLLAPGCAFFTESGEPIPLTDVGEKTTVVVKRCDEHVHDFMAANPGAPTHTWTCTACNTTVESEPCTFAIEPDGDGNGTAACGCGNEIKIVIAAGANDLIYNGAEKTSAGVVGVYVSLEDGTPLEEDKDYEISYTGESTNVGDFTVKVDGITYKGTFEKTFSITQNHPEIKWDNSTCEMPYDGDSVEAAVDLPHITITLQNGDSTDLSSLIQYSCRKWNTDQNFIEGLPTNAGTYEIKASLRGQTNYAAAETNPCLKLTIDKISPFVNPAADIPEARTLTYNRTPQELVTAGKVRDGAAIEFKLGETGEYSAAIPTGTNAGGYRVWYQVKETENYEGASAEIQNVKITPKPITPTVILSETSFVYDGSRKEPKITVRDEQTVIEDDQYTFRWERLDSGSGQQDADTTEPSLKEVGKYRAVITAAAGGNYTFAPVSNDKTTFEIVEAAQGALSITGKPSVVCYGDTIALSTTGGTGNGKVTWKVTDGNKATISEAGVLKVKDIGSITVTAERSVDNYETVEATWTFTAEKKPVTAVLTGKTKPYDGNTSAEAEAKVDPGDLESGDSITIPNLTGNFEDPNVGTNKKITITSPAPAVTGTNSGKYAISYPATTTADITVKSVTPTVTLTGNDLQTDNSATPKYFYYYDGTEKKPDVVVAYTENGKSITILPGNYTVSYSNNKNVGKEAAVTVSSANGGNYTFTAVTEKFEIKNAKAALTSSPQANSLTYNGNPQDLVRVGTAAGGTVVYSSTGALGSYKSAIPQGTGAGEYTVYYMIEGDGNHEDNAGPFAPIYVTIRPKEITPAVTLAPTSFVYTGDAKEPAVTVRDGDKEIDSSEYIVSYRSNINAGTATAIVSNANGGNYIVNGSADFTITKADIAVKDENKPTGRMNLPYNGAAQELIVRGSPPDGGTMVYALDGKNYSEAVPAAVAVENYTVYYKVLGDSNHNDSKDSEVGTVSASIIKNTVNNPTITLSADTFKYNGSQQKPSITVRDDKGLLIPENEYEVAYSYNKPENSGENSDNILMVDVGTYTITVTSRENSNYDIKEGKNTAAFHIVEADQETIAITGMRGQVYYGDVIQLGITGGTGNGTVTWKVTNDAGELNWIDRSSGLLTVNGTGGPITVTAKRTSSTGNYKEASTTWVFYAGKKPVTAVVTVAGKTYDGTTTASVTYAGVRSSDLVEGDTVTIDKSKLTAAFTDKDAGTNKTVTLNKPQAAESGTNADKYDVGYPDTVTADITPKPVNPSITLADMTSMIYDGSAKTPAVIVKDGDVEINKTNGVDEYTVSYQNNVNAGTATVIVSNVTGGNYIVNGTAYFTIGKATPDITQPPAASSVTSGHTLSESVLEGGAASAGGVTVPGIFSWVNGSTVPTDGNQYEVIFTPYDTNNYNTVTIEVPVTVTAPDSGETGSSGTNDREPSSQSMYSLPAAGEAGAVSETGTVRVLASVRDGTASAVLDTAAGNELVNAAVANQSTNVVIIPEIDGDVTKTEVSIPAAAISRIKNETGAALTVSTPIADVTIPNAALDTLSGAGSAVSVVTERVDNTVVLTLTADGRDVGNIPGGLTLTIPAENAGPGTVAVLVHEDGTRETIRWSVAEDGGVRIPLDGSATVEIVDNSKDFADVPAESWAADAVAFASAHELFNGTGETTFSPEQPMNRAMLAAVLYNLEGCPDQSLSSEFSDVDSGAWYAAGVSWAAANGIAGGYGDGEFGPDDNLTREQFAVMLWRYAGSPAADEQALDFTDAEQVSSYAAEALCWASANGIVNGHGNGQLDPCGLATRAQAAQMMKNFIENT